MSIRQMFPGSIVKPGFNPLAAQTETYNNYLYSWGQNTTYGQGGLGDEINRSSPVQVGSSADWASAKPGTDHTIALKTNGTIWSWGQNQYGQLGLGDTTNRSSPVQIGALTNWAAVQGATESGVAIKTDGTLWSWGFGNQGMLGLGNTTTYSSPKQVGLLTNWLKISGRGQCYGAIKTDGSLWVWGNNGNGGGLGTGNVINRSSPVQVGSLTNWLQVSAGNYMMGAVKTDGTIWAWGNNNSGPLGQNDVIARSSPTQIGALTNWLNISAGTYHFIALKTNGTLWAWGYNNVQAQLGDNSVIDRSSPVQIGSLTNWSSIGTGGYTSFAITTSGALYSWGRNNAGQLGQNISTYRVSSPVQVGSLTTWYSANGGNAFTLALLY
jgi:alpha-tubulin suppressor-like RCC1 family protein